MNYFLISPVRLITDTDKKEVQDFISKLEKEGNKVYWPYRDTVQIEEFWACQVNREAIYDSDEVLVWYKEGSKGILFDLGMAFALEKPIRLVSGEEELVGGDVIEFCLRYRSPVV